MIEYLPEPGTPVEALETPALLIELPILEQNLDTIHPFFRSRPAKVRSVTKSHKCPALAQIQMTKEGSVPYGLCCAKVSEAEVMADAGARDIRMIAPVVGKTRIDHLMRLARRLHISALVDDRTNIDALSEAAQAHQITLDLIVEVDIGVQRGGVQPGQAALELALYITKSPNLRFAGLSGHDRSSGILNSENRHLEIRKRLQRILDTREQLERAGIPILICGAGSTGSWQLAGTLDGITEISAGTYALMDSYSTSPNPEFAPALRILSSVISRPARNRAITDFGNKTLGFGSADGNMPVILNPGGLAVRHIYSEQAALELQSDACHLRLGDKVMLIPSNHGAAALAFDHFVGMRDGKVECIWEITGRGAHC